MDGIHSPAKKVTVLVALGLVGLVVVLFAGVIELFGLVGVAVSAALLVVLGLVAAAAGASLAVAFELFAYAVGIVRVAAVRVRNHLGR